MKRKEIIKWSTRALFLAIIVFLLYFTGILFPGESNKTLALAIVTKEKLLQLCREYGRIPSHDEMADALSKKYFTEFKKLGIMVYYSPKGTNYIGDNWQLFIFDRNKQQILLVRADKKKDSNDYALTSKIVKKQEVPNDLKKWNLMAP